MLVASSDSDMIAFMRDAICKRMLIDLWHVFLIIATDGSANQVIVDLGYNDALLVASAIIETDVCDL